MRQKKSKLDSTNAEALALVRVEPDRAAKMADWAFKESQKLRYPKGQADSQRVFAALLCSSDPASANDFAEKALHTYNQIGDEASAASLLMSIARYNQNSGWINRAHFDLIEAYEKASASGNDKVRAAALFNLGANAEDRSDFPVALEYFSRAKVVAEELGYEQTYWRAVCAEQEMHYKLKDGAFQVELVEEALRILSVAGRESSLIELLMFFSAVEHDQGDTASARRYLRQAYSLATQTSNEQAKAEILYQFGVNRIEQGRLKSAKNFLEMALRAANALDIPALKLLCFRKLGHVLYRLGEPARAYEAIDQFVNLKDELNVQESERHFEEMRTVQQVQVVEKESKALKQKNTELGAVNQRLEAALQETQKLQRELQRLVTIDELTGALNRRELLARGNEIVSRFHSQGRPGAIMIVDIDHFKSINDNFGHATGDEVLRRFTKSCQRVLRPTDSFGRLGGEEFCILLDRTKLDIAVKVADRVLRSIRSTRVSDIMGDRIVTASIGLTEVNGSHDSIETALHDADTSLYEAKGTGRDKICVAGVKKKKAA